MITKFITKKNGFQTPEIPLVYKYLSSFSNNDSWDLEIESLLLNQTIVKLTEIPVYIKEVAQFAIYYDKLANNKHNSKSMLYHTASHI